MDRSALVERLAALPELEDLPRHELLWLVEHGELEAYEPGIMVAPGEPAEYLWLVLSGCIAVRVDQGVGARRVIEWRAGSVTGLLPFSRMGPVRNEVLADAPTQTLQIHRDYFPEMVGACPSFTALSVQTMVDRARQFNTSALQDEKMISLGRLAAGLAHELNNPASATMRGAKRLRTGLRDTERASRTVARAGLSESLSDAVETLWSTWSDRPTANSSFELEDGVSEWLRARGLQDDLAPMLAEMSATPDRLDEIARLVPDGAIGATLEWIAAGSDARVTAADIEDAATRIYDLVAAVKRFTRMDKVEDPTLVDVEAGLRDTISILKPGLDAKGASIALEARSGLPAVQAVAGDLNQVWMKLIENAVYAIGPSGTIRVSVGAEPDRIVVRIVDDGPGIDPEVLPHVFDPFFTTKPPGDGMGLGLEIARQLVRRYGGEVDAESEPGRTEFRVRLPVPA